MYRTAALILALAATLFFAVRSGEEPVRALQKPEVRPAPEVLGATRKGRAPRLRRRSGISRRRGAFPTTTSSKRTPTSATARAVRLLIDSRLRKEEEFVLIARDVKASYSDYDAV